MSGIGLTALADLVRSERPRTLVHVGGPEAISAPTQPDFETTTQSVHVVPDHTDGERDRQELIRMLDGRQIDLLVLGGDDYYRVRAAFVDYAPLVRDRGLIAFSGLDAPDTAAEMRHLWDQLAPVYDTREMHGEAPGDGLGVLRWVSGQAVRDLDPSPDGSGFALTSHFDRPPGEPVLDLDTTVGPLLLPESDQVITPVLRDHGIWEPPETRWVRATVRRGQTFVDVGAHVGYFSVLAANLVGPSGTVIAVEPEPRSRDLLHRNLVRNGVENAHVVPFAAGATRTWMSLAVEEHNRGGHHLVALEEAPTVVRCVRLDDVLPATVDVVKIDAQGYDHEILEGLERTFARNPHLTVLAELSWHEVVRRRRIDPASVLARWEALGFVLALPDPYGRARPASTDVVLEVWRQIGWRSIELSVILTRPERANHAPRRPARAGGLELSESDDGLTIHDASGATHQLNHTAALVFDLCTGVNAVEEIVEHVRLEYGLTDPPRVDVRQCLAQLRLSGLVV